MSEPKRRLVLVDGNSVLYRSFFAIKARLTNREGLPTNAVYGFTRVLRKILADESPDLAAVTFDAGGKTFRHEMYREYKANRPPVPDDLARQLPYSRDVCDVLGLLSLEIAGVEADDLIGTLARRAVERGYRVYVVSSDKDFLQLVSDDITVVHPDLETRYDREGVRKKFGVEPELVVDVLGLMGDSSDNVPGVRGIGEKGAIKLISEWGSIENLLEHADEVTGKRQGESLKEQREQALLSKKLVTLATDVDLDVDLENLEYRGVKQHEAYELFESLGFTTLLKDYLPDTPAAEITVACEAMNGRQALRAAVEEVQAERTLGLWLELGDSKSPDPGGGTLASVGLAARSGTGFYVVPGSLDEKTLLDALRGPLTSGGIAKLGHDLKRTVLFLRAQGIDLRGLGFDVKIAAYLLNPARRAQDIDALCLEFLHERIGAVAAPQRELQPRLPGVGGSETTDAATLAAQRAECLLRLSEAMRKRLADEELERLYEELELPLIDVLADMEHVGIAIDDDAFSAMSEELEEQVAALAEQIYEMAGREFNINSSRQLGEILFEEMVLPSFKKTQKQRMASTRADVLESLARHFEFPRKVLDYKSLTKLKGTYVDALPLARSPRTGRIHTTFNQTATATGRLSSSDPNMQNIPIRTELGRRVRRAFVAQGGWKLLSADYSQIELRVLAHLSLDEALIQAFRRGEDIHDRTARQVFGEDSSLGESELRRRAKIINFSIIYGKTAHTLGEDFGVSTREAQAFIDSYFERYPKVRELLDSIIRDARKTGKVKTLFGRHRYVPEIAARNRNTRLGAERIAVNTPIQGTAADLIKKAMLDLWRALRQKGYRARLLLQVHDELVLEVPDSEVDEVSALVRETMESVYPLEIPLVVDVKVGQSWEH